MFRQEPLDRRQVSAQNSGVDALARHFRILPQDARGAKPSRRVVRVPGVPVLSSRRNSVSENGLLHKLGNSLGVTSVGERVLGEFVLQCRPVREAVLLRECILDVAQAGFGRGFEPGALQTRARLKVVGAQGLEPTLGFFLEIVEGAFRGELSTHGTFLPLRCLRSAEVQAERRL